MNCDDAFFQQIGIPFFMKSLNLLTTLMRFGDYYWPIVLKNFAFVAVVLVYKHLFVEVL